MSHNIVLSKVNFKDLMLLGQVAASVSEGSCSLEPDTKTFRTYRGQDNKCDAMIKMGGNYDIGLLKAEDGYTPVADFSMMKWNNPFAGGGNDVGKLQQEYILREAEYTAAQNGMTSSRVTGKNGTVVLELAVAS